MGRLEELQAFAGATPPGKARTLGILARLVGATESDLSARGFRHFASTAIVQRNPLWAIVAFREAFGLDLAGAKTVVVSLEPEQLPAMAAAIDQGNTQALAELLARYCRSSEDAQAIALRIVEAFGP